MPSSPTLETSQGIILHNEELLPELPSVEILSDWLQRILRQESHRMGSLFYVFLDDEALLKINREHLQHDTYTDIITFPYSTHPVEAEIYISADRIRANARDFNVPIYEEVLRVMAHGVLHLCGWLDKSEADSQLMRKREDACLALLGIIYSVTSPS